MITLLIGYALPITIAVLVLGKGVGRPGAMYLAISLFVLFQIVLASVCYAKLREAMSDRRFVTG